MSNRSACLISGSALATSTVYRFALFPFLGKHRIIFRGVDQTFTEILSKEFSIYEKKRLERKKVINGSLRWKRTRNQG